MFTAARAASGVANEDSGRHGRLHERWVVLAGAVVGGCGEAGRREDTSGLDVPQCAGTEISQVNRKLFLLSQSYLDTYVDVVIIVVFGC